MPGERSAGQARQRSPHARWLVRRWPTALALAAGAANWGMDVVTAGQLLQLLPLVYVVMAALRRRRLSWPVMVGCLLVVVLVNVQHAVDPAVALVALATVVTLSGLVRQPRAGRGEAALQAVAFVVLVAVAALGLALEPDVGRVVLAAGWLAHGLWDLAHLRRDRVVSRSYAEWCAVFDLVIAATLLLASRG